MNLILRAALLLLPLLYPLPPVAKAAAAASNFVDPLDRPAQASQWAEHSLLSGLAQAGRRVVAVGQRGHVLYSEDGGAHWRQAAAPLSTDLVTVRFTGAHEGWAVGHDSVVLHTIDGGASWERQYDGRRDPAAGDKPLLDVWFDQQGRGYAVGAFGLLLYSADSGHTWQHWESHADNPQGLHLNAVRAVGDEVYIAGEQGLLLKRSADGNRFEALSAPYKGSYFGLAGKDKQLVVFGLRGTALYSSDGGAHWQPSVTGTQTGLIDGAFLADGSVLLLSQSGQLLRSRDGGATFKPQPGMPALPASALLVQQQGGVLIAGARGVRAQAMKD
jgi:photosystem II stability/assembly factor-like uncharacterized protein